MMPTPKKEPELVGRTTFTGAFAEHFTDLEAQADQELEQTNVNFRWGREQVEVVKRAAAIIGVPYQTYLKQVVYKHAIEDIERLSRVR
ncbi:MAG: hypothetical protein ACRDHX_16810 [Chloroflexota bacterium]